MEADRNRWLMALSAIAIHLSIGSVYAYSVYQNPLNESLGWNISDVTLAFTIAIFFLGMSAASLGFLVEKYGPRISAAIAAVLFGAGTMGAGLAVQLESLPLFIGSYGVLGGIGLGIGYISPVSTLVMWFPDRRGMATGMAVMGFGAGALITSPLAEWLMNAVSIPGAFYILGASYFVLMLAGASYMKKPPKDWMPKGYKKEDLQTNQKGGDLAQLSAKEALRTMRFYLLWLVMFINISSGIMLLAVASNMTQTITGTSAALAATIVGVMGFFNGGGRIVWASLSDYLGRTNTFTIFFLIQIVAFFLLPLTTNVVLLAILLFIIITCYGGGFACLPAYIGDLFGTKQLGAIHGFLLTAWALAGVAGPTAVSSIVSATGSYALSFYLFNILLVVALAAMIVMRFNIKKVRKNKEQESTEAAKA